MTKRHFARFFSVDSPKAIKAQKHGYLNAINYMAPADIAGVGNLCPHASTGCKALCLGWFSGQAGMVKGNRKNARNSVRNSRLAKSRMFMRDRPAFLEEMVTGVKAAERAASRKGLKLCVRLNGATDIGWEGVRLPSGLNAFESFPEVQFVDYTKSKRRALAFAAGKLPANYHLTFSRSETNEGDCLEVLAAGGTVAAVFAGPLPETWNGYPVIDGDEHDLRHLDGRGVVVGLSPKGVKARRDKSGFVIH